MNLKLTYVYVYIGIYQQAFCRSFKQMKENFWGDIFYPRFEGKQDSSPCFILTNFKNELDELQHLMYVLFILIVWFTFQYNCTHYWQFFQELYWVLELSVSLCLKLRRKFFASDLMLIGGDFNSRTGTDLN